MESGRGWLRKEVLDTVLEPPSDFPKGQADFVCHWPHLTYGEYPSIYGSV